MGKNSKITRHGEKVFFVNKDKKVVVGKYYIHIDVLEEIISTCPRWVALIVTFLYKSTYKNAGSFEIKSKTVCHEPDVFSEEIGIKVADEKLDLKMHDIFARRCYYISQKLMEASNRIYEIAIFHDNKAAAIEDDMLHYYYKKDA